MRRTWKTCTDAHKKGAALGQGRLPSGKNTTIVWGPFSVPKVHSADLLLFDSLRVAILVATVYPSQRSCHAQNAFADVPLGIEVCHICDTPRCVAHVGPPCREWRGTVGHLRSAIAWHYRCSLVFRCI